MGLDIEFASMITPSGDEDDMHLENHPDFLERGDGIYPEYYKLGGITGEFRAGSYGHYNEWRATLSKAIHHCEPGVIWKNPDAYADKPFVEIINFTDCDGFIGPRTAAKLYKDFNDYRNVFYAEIPNSWMRERYDDFTRAFKAAALGGVVVFA